MVMQVNDILTAIDLGAVALPEFQRGQSPQGRCACFGSPSAFVDDHALP